MQSCRRRSCCRLLSFFSPFECSGTSSHDLSGGAKLDLTFCLCTANDSEGSQWNVRALC